MAKRACIIAGCIGFVCLSAEAQETEYGISVPITLSGDVAYSHGLQSQDGQTSVTPGFRAVLSPSLRLGPHWFVYSNLEVRSSSYFPYETGSDDKPQVQFGVMQAFVGYTTRIRKVSLLLKAGQLSSAFGFFPLQYDDAKTAFPDPPPSYITNLPLRPDQLPCGVNDLLWQKYGSEVEFYCGGAQTNAYGMFPVTLYGLPSIQAELSVARLDARFQITNSSPANPQGFASPSLPQWTGGGGYTLPGGLHVGISAFRGPYLDRILDPLLPRGTTVHDFPAIGLGIDAQWARGRLSMEGEWQHFQFDLPRFVRSPSERVAYVQVKTILTPRTFVAARATVLDFGRVQDTSGTTANHFAGPQQAYEFAFGYRPNRHQLIKAGYEWIARNDSSINPGSQTRGGVFQVQLVTALSPFSRAFH